MYKANDTTLDGLIERQSTLSKDLPGRARLLQEIQRRLIDQSWLLGILSASSFTVAWPYVKDWGKGVAWGQAAEGDHLTTVWLDK